MKAGIVNEAWDYTWSSVHAHLSGKSDGVVTVEPMQNRVDNWKEFIAAMNLSDEGCFRRHARTGRPLGDEGFVRQVSKRVGRDLLPRKAGRKKKEK